MQLRVLPYILVRRNDFFRLITSVLQPIPESPWHPRPRVPWRWLLRGDGHVPGLRHGRPQDRRPRRGALLRHRRRGRPPLRLLLRRARCEGAAHHGIGLRLQLRHRGGVCRLRHRVEHDTRGDFFSLTFLPGAAVAATTEAAADVAVVNVATVAVVGAVAIAVVVAAVVVTVAALAVLVAAAVAVAVVYGATVVVVATAAAEVVISLLSPQLLMKLLQLPLLFKLNPAPLEKGYFLSSPKSRTFYCTFFQYIIGTAACACALSACLDILSNGWISNITDAWSGPGEIIGTLH